MRTTKLSLNNNKVEQLTGDTINLSGNTVIYGSLQYYLNPSNLNKNSLVSKDFVTGFTNYIVTNSNSFIINNQHKNTSIYFTNTGSTSVYIPDTVDSGLTFTTIRTVGAGIVTHVATGTSSLNTMGNEVTLEEENCASTWQYIGDSEWYGFGALGAQSTGGTSSIGGGNGLTKVGSNIVLGGTLSGNTTIDGNFNFNFAASGNRLGNFRVWSNGTVGLDGTTSSFLQSSGTTITATPLGVALSSMSGLFVINNNDLKITDNRATPRGLSANADYSANYQNLDYVSKLYVDNQVFSGVTANNGLIKLGNNITLGGSLTGNTTIDSTGFDFNISNSTALFSINSDATVQLNLGSDATNDIYSRNSSGNLQRIAAGTGSTLLMMNSGGTGHIYSKINTTHINNSQVTIAKLANSAGGTRIIGRSANSAGVLGEIAATADGQSLRRVGGVLGFGNASTVSFTVGTLPAATTAGQMIYVSDESGGAVIAFSDGTNWRRVTDRAIVS